MIMIEFIWNAALIAASGSNAGVVATTTERYTMTVTMPTIIPLTRGLNSVHHTRLSRDEMQPMQTKNQDQKLLCRAEFPSEFLI